MLHFPSHNVGVVCCHTFNSRTYLDTLVRCNPSRILSILWQDIEHIGAFCFNGTCISERVSLGCPLLRLSPWIRIRADPESHVVGAAKFFNVVGYNFLGAVANGYHAENTRDPNKDTEDG